MDLLILEDATADGHPVAELFKCLSSGWLTLISDRRFVETHLNLNNKRECLILISRPVRECLTLISRSAFSVDCTESSNNDVVTATKLDFPLICSCEMDIIGSCNGLILLASGQQTIMFLWNPSTREVEQLPNSLTCPYQYRAKPNTISSCRMYGLGYDSSIDDYKVVEIIHSDILTCLYEYTLRTGSWRLRRSWVSDFLYVISRPSGVLLNGSVHWLAYKYSNDGRDSNLYEVIGAFDLTDNEFRDIYVPSSVPSSLAFSPHAVWISNDLGVLGGCLTVLVCPNFTRTDVCVMKEYGVTESWTKCRVELQCLRINGRIRNPFMLSLGMG
ncbi:F-box protein CPR1-like [Cornus florida]|uniref:F-box protein CPR1-like n=1 Tax=Cornus florida TaxID=4283 RepID=UPI00289E0474|nr:F-box protein CPR1-like [Cornus florida]